MSAPHPDWLVDGWEHIWLPYTQMQSAQMPPAVVSAEGCRLTLADGTELLDGISSWWSMCHGYQHPHLVDSMRTQLETLSHVMFAGLANQPAYRLASRLSSIAPEGLERCFFSDSGSTAVEVALKMALQYWRNKGELRKNKFICFNGGYHGDTFGTMTVSGRSVMNQAFESMLHKHYVLDIPTGEYSFAEFTETVESIAPTVAAMVVEPLVQGAGGMRFYSADILAEMRRVCREHDILLICDEVLTGFGRLGTMFACEEAGISPDIMCLGKGLTGGMMTLAATLATNDIYEAFLDDSIEKALMHGPTFMANALACSAANASLDLFETEPRLAQAEAIEQQLREQLTPLRELKGVVDVRCKGALGVVQIEANQADMFALRPLIIEQGVWLRPFGDVLYIMPPFITSAQELQAMCDAATVALKTWSATK